MYRSLHLAAGWKCTIEVDLQLQPTELPPLLYHGTAAHKMNAIMREGLRKMRRHHAPLT